MRKRVETENNALNRKDTVSPKYKQLRGLISESHGDGVFQTEIIEYKTKIAKIREAKELKKKKLEQ